MTSRVSCGEEQRNELEGKELELIPVKWYLAV